MYAYPEVYRNEIVENQGKLFDFVAYNFPDKDTREFIVSYMMSKTRKCIDEAQAYICTMDAKEIWEYFSNTEKYALKDGKSIQGFAPDWMGEFYAYYQWFYNVPSSEIIKKVPVDYLLRAYPGLHDLDLELSVKKVGEV